jgi:hypothetical protein
MKHSGSGFAPGGRRLLYDRCQGCAIDVPRLIINTREAP